MDNTKTQFINDEEEDALWEEFKKTKSDSLRDKIIHGYALLLGDSA